MSEAMTFVKWDIYRAGAGERYSRGYCFTRDDELAHGKEVAPRDNVVFEARYFAAAKGKPRVLIIREEGSKLNAQRNREFSRTLYAQPGQYKLPVSSEHQFKLPADLRGDIYGALPDQSDITPIEDTIRKFVKYRL